MKVDPKDDRAQLHDLTRNAWCGDQHAQRVALQASAAIRTMMQLLGSNALHAGEQGKQFLHVATRAVRRMLVDQARVERAARCIGFDIPNVERVPSEAWEGLLELDALLVRLERVDPRQAAIVEYRLFSHLRFDDIALLLGLTITIVIREWRMACAWIKRRERAAAEGSPPLRR